jgi:hypothetical protein
MRLLNLRYGFATNSSSTHSIIFMPKGKQAQYIPSESSGFGWDFFQLTDAEHKKEYLAAMVMGNLVHAGVEEEAASATAKAWAGVPSESWGYGIDHQSFCSLPKTWDGKEIHRGFFEDFKAFILRDDIVIAGGNDNGDGEPEALTDGGVSLNRLDYLFGRGDGGPSRVARKDSGHWTVFDRDSGTKTRLAFDDTPHYVGQPSFRSQAPELVDIKITDYCPFNCSYCYQDSTLEGKHGNEEWLSSLVGALGDANVFEVALGGGEPTLYPHFLPLLRKFRAAGVVPNFTSKNLAWLRQPFAEEVFGLIGGWAYSAETVQHAERLLSEVEACTKDFKGSTRAKTSIQHVVGLLPEDEFRELLRFAAKNWIRVVLLGFKEVGRGLGFGARQRPRWLEIVQEVNAERNLILGVDTALADQYWGDILAAGVRENYMTRTEGQFSCYIDGVAQTINTSSYTSLGAVSVTPQNFLSSYARMAHERVGS